jgi:hypothetical protein
MTAPPSPRGPIKGHTFSVKQPISKTLNGIVYVCGACKVEVLVPAHFMTTGNLLNGVDIHLTELARKPCKVELPSHS